MTGLKELIFLLMIINSVNNFEKKYPGQHANRDTIYKCSNDLFIENDNTDDSLNKTCLQVVQVQMINPIGCR